MKLTSGCLNLDVCRRSGLSRWAPVALPVLLALSACGGGSGAADVAGSPDADGTTDVRADLHDQAGQDGRNSDLTQDWGTDDGEQSEPNLELPDALTSVPVLSRFEVGFDLPYVASNPFDPDEIRVDVELVAPDSKSMLQPAFFYQPCKRTPGEYELVEFDGAAQWRVRFTPREVGTWRWRIVAKAGEEEWRTPYGEFEATAALPGAKGFLQATPVTEPESPRYLQFSDKTPFYPIGENMAWADGRGTGAYDVWVNQLADHGGNYIRLWMASWGFALETLPGSESGIPAPGLGNYAHRMTQAWQLDYVFDLAQARGVTIMLCLVNHGLYSLEHNSEWDTNPYNQANGGPLASPDQFFTNPEARKWFKQRLRYVVARWGYSPHLLAWELFNEVDLTEQHDPKVLADWHAEMASELKALDPHGHMVTTSMASLAMLLGIDQAIWSLPQMDLVQFHLYGREGFDVKFKEVLPQEVARLLTFGKPVLAGEVGVDFAGPAETIARDPSFVAFHEILWVPLLSGAIGTGMHWWWDSVVEPQDLYGHFAAFQLLLKGVDLGSAAVVTGLGESMNAEAPVKVLTLRQEGPLLAWIQNSADDWASGGNGDTVAGARIKLTGVKNGNYSVSWVETWDASEASGGVVQAADSTLELDVPPFVHDIALRLVLE